MEEGVKEPEGVVEQSGWGGGRKEEWKENPNRQ